MKEATPKCSSSFERVGRARLIRRIERILLILLLAAPTSRLCAQSSTFAGNAQHTAVYPVRAQHMNRILWTATVDVTQNSSSSHYGAPLITASNTVIVPTVASSSNYTIKAYEGGTGRLKYTLTNDYWATGRISEWPVYQPVLVGSPTGLRLYYPGAGGTVYYVENPDSDTPSQPIQLCFYTNLTGYASNAAAFNTNLFINTPLTGSTNGEIYFAFYANGTIPAPFNTNIGGFVRIDPDGNGTYVLTSTAAGSASARSSPVNCAPALSNDGSTVYVVGGGHLIGLDSVTLATKYVRSGVSPGGTASPTVGPDGDVYLGVLGSSNWGRLLHFSGDLTTIKLSGAFGWDHTAAVVPSSAVPAYNGPSSYLLFCKYNDYNTRNRIALLDPNVSQYSANFGATAMREVFTAFSPTIAVYNPSEWCINTAAVNPIASCVFAPNEDGQLYRWDFAANCLSETIALNAGVQEPYVPTCIGPDGAIYTIIGGTLYAIGQWTNLDVTISSSVPDLTSVVALQPLTFAATVTNLNPADPVPTGTVTFRDITYLQDTPIRSAIRVTNILATNVVLSNYTASLTISTLSSNSGNHFITAIYSGDTNFPSTSISMVQKVHAQASRTQITSSILGSNQVKFLATVTPAGNGMISIWDGTNFLWQAEPGTYSSSIVFTNTTFAPGPHAVTARYYSDSTYAASAGALVGVPATLNQMQVMGDGSFVLGFTNVSGAPFTVLSSTDLLAPVSGWAVLGQASEVLPGQFQYSDAQALNRDAVRFYRLRSP